MTAISVTDVWLKYRIDFKENGRLVSEDFWGLKGVSFQVSRGEAVAIIGENGAGKSTLLKVVAGMLKPDKGTSQVAGRVAGLIDLGAGFHKELTGKENIYLVSSLFGFSRTETDARYEDIVNFASLGRFINAPVKSYSQGMYMRLGFAIAIHVEPDILIIDESFAVGDTYAQRKCIEKLFELKNQGKTILFVSHDLQMARRICSRGILLREGTVIKDGAIDQVCAYYAAAVGEKKGIAFLEQAGLGAVFNNGKLMLQWNGAMVTLPGTGQAVVTLDGREYLSVLADWQLERSGTALEGIVATGRWPDTSIVLRWKIAIASAHELSCEILVEAPQGTSPERFEISMIMPKEFEKWFSVASQKELPALFLPAQEWQCEMVPDALSRLVGLRPDASSSFPLIIFDRLLDNPQTKCHIGNTGADLGARVLNYVVFPEKEGSCGREVPPSTFRLKLAFLDPHDHASEQAYLSRARRILEELVVLRSGPLSVLCADHRVQIYWQEKLLTRGQGVNTQFEYKDKNYSAINGKWIIHKESENEVLIVVSWDDIPGLRQLWRLAVKDQEVILWDVSAESDGGLKMINRQAELLLDDQFTRWLTPVESGGFEKIEKRGGVVVLDSYINRCVGLMRPSGGAQDSLPITAFSHDGSESLTSYIFKIHDPDFTAIKLQYVAIDEKGQVSIAAGQKPYFKGRINIAGYPRGNSAKELSFCDAEAVPVRGHAQCEISCGRTRFVFRNGKGRIFWDGVELTQGLGFYSSIFLQERWHDSSQASWEAAARDGNRLIATGSWPWVPVKQTWEVSLTDERAIAVKISRNVWDQEGFVASREQVSLMLSGIYREWCVSQKMRAKFPSDFIEHNGAFWERLWCADTSHCLGVAKGLVREGFLKVRRLPAVFFESSERCQTRHAIVENSDDLFQGRVLQYEMIVDKNVQENAAVYFEGMIKIAR